MKELMMIISLSMVMWYLIDRGKKEIWGSVRNGKWMTIFVAAGFAAALVFSYGLDLLHAVEITQEVTTTGKIITVLVLMSGSSAVAEIIERVRGEQDHAD